MYQLVRNYAQKVLRATRLLWLVEIVRFRYREIKLYSKNNRFIREHPDFSLPPAELAFDAYSSQAWHYYKSSGEAAAQHVADEIEKNVGSQSVTILEWGCGPGRIIRHLPERIGNSNLVIGADYNPETIVWNKKNLKNITSIKNDLLPPIDLDDDSIDFAYAISVFTHLSDQSCRAWFEELHRVIRSGGFFLFTTAGDFYNSLGSTLDEKIAYSNEGFIVRGSYEEGKKMFLTRHSPDYIKKIITERFEVVSHKPAGFPSMDQDEWIVKAI